MDDEIAPPPDDTMIVMRAPTGHGWVIQFDGEPRAYFSTAADMCSWIQTVLTPLDIEAGVIPRAEPVNAVTDEDLPRVLSDAAKSIETKPARLWRVLAGGRR